MRHEDLIGELEGIVGAEFVSTADSDRVAYGQDALKEVSQPAVVVWPRTAEEIAEVMRLANRELVPVTPRAGGVGYTGGAVPVEGGIVIGTDRMNRIREVSVENLFVISSSFDVAPVAFSITCSSDLPSGISLALRAVNVVSIVLRALRSSRAALMSACRSSVCCSTCLFLPPVIVRNASNIVLTPVRDIGVTDGRA